MKKMNGKTVSCVKGVYLCLLTIYAIIREVLPIQGIVGSSLLTYGFFIAGIVIAGICVIFDWRPYLSRSQRLPMVFLLLCVVSTVLNVRYALMSNVKAIAWMTLYFLIFLPEGPEKETEGQLWRNVLWTAVTVLFLMALLSLPMYFFDVDYTYLKESGFPNNQGFSHQYVRLWGLYRDANTAGVYSLLGVCIAAYLFVKTRNLLPKIYLAVAAFSLSLMMILANSRTTQVAFICAVAWIFAYVGFTKNPEKKIVNKLLITVVALVVSFAVSIGFYAGGKAALPYAKAVLLRNASASGYGNVHAAYDLLYKNSGLNITQGYYELPENVEDPSEPTTDPEAIEVTGDPDRNEITGNVEALDRTDKKADVSNGRFQKWMEILEVVRHSPVFGVSPRGIAQAAKDVAPDSTIAKYGFAAHNSLLEVLAGTGAVGLLVVLAIFVILARNILIAFMTRKFDWEVLLYSVVLLIMVCEMMFISDGFFGMTFGGVAFWMAAGRIMNLRKE